MKAALALALVVGCTVDRTVLEAAIIDCTNALEAYTGQLCNFDMTCSAITSDCCTTAAYCRDGALVVDRECNPDCSICADDTQCTEGAAVCTSNRCVPCPLGCPACPAGWQSLSRNGCLTCDCAPPPTCFDVGSPCPNGICYPGAVCSQGCAAADPGCCSNQCELAGCVMPIPTGCLMPCPPILGGCSTCAADRCECMPATGQWSCTAICADGVNAGCLAPPDPPL